MKNDVNPLWVRSFVAVYQHGSFTRAADSLDLTQAAVSQHIQRLEAEMGQLLVRRPRQIELTPAGLSLLNYAQALDLANARLRRSLANQDPHRGEISISTPGSIGLVLYPKLLALQAVYPELSIRYRSAPTSDTIAAVLDKRFELGLVTRMHEDERLIVRPFAQEKLCLVLPVNQRDASWPALLALGFIDHPDGKEMATRLFFQRYPSGKFDQLPIRGFTNQIGMILEPVARGLGFTVLPRFAVESYAKPELIHVANDDAELMDKLWLIYRAEWPLSAAAAFAVEKMAAEFSEGNWG